MKKMIALLMFLMLSSMVFAQHGSQINLKANLPVGLNKALVNVDNEQARQVIERNMERFQEQHKERLQYCTDNDGCQIKMYTFGNDTTVETEETVKIFGLINAKSRETLRVNDEGDIIDESKNFGRYMYQWGLARQINSGDIKEIFDAMPESRQETYVNQRQFRSCDEIESFCEANQDNDVCLNYCHSED